MSRRCLLLGCAVLFSIAAALVSLWYSFTTTPLLTGRDQASVLVTMAPGMTTSELARSLMDKQLLSSPRLFRVLARLKQQSHRLQAGVYQITAEDTPVSLLTKMTNGEVMQSSVTLLDGWTLRNILETLNSLPHIQHTLTSITELNRVFAGKQGTAEGLFYPDTYQYKLGSSDREILHRARDTLEQTLRKVWAERAQGLPYETPYELLIAASVIEKETGKASERALVSSVIINRLRKGMRLQMDPTVIYGLGELYQGKLSRQELRKDTPYNTYRHKGLPPTPIAAVGFKSLWAAAHPAASQYYYFVAKGRGSHHFSRTLSEQKQAIQRYLLSKNGLSK